MIGSSGTCIDKAGGKRTSRSIIEILREYQGWPNLDGATNVAAGPHEWAAYLTGWRKGHEHEATIRLGVKEEDKRRFESVIV
jgi:hypothetical protein